MHCDRNAPRCRPAGHRALCAAGIILLLTGVPLIAGAQPFNVPVRDPKVNMRFDR